MIRDLSHKVLLSWIISQVKTPEGVCVKMAGVEGIEPSKCQIQSLMPYRLAIPQCLKGNSNSNEKKAFNQDTFFKSCVIVEKSLESARIPPISKNFFADASRLTANPLSTGDRLQVKG
jgi:hypothetical protein